MTEEPPHAIRTARAEAQAHAVANRAAINAAWAAEWDGRTKPLSGEQKRLADAEWASLDNRGNVRAKKEMGA